MRLKLFNVMVVQVLLYGYEVWGGTISFSAWNEREKLQTMFLRRQLGVKILNMLSYYAIRNRCLAIEVLAMKEYTSISQM